MKVFGAALIIALVSCAWIARAQQLSIANLTTCGLDCLLETIPQANCSIADQQCQCSSTTLPQLTSACLLVNCTMHDSLVVAKVTASVCDYPHPDRSAVPLTVTAIVVTTASIFILLRLISKQWVSGSLGAEDWIIASALLLSYASTYFAITFCHEGFGKHIWDLNDGDLSLILENFYISENIYVITLALSKISILVFYLRIFPHEWFRWTAMAVIIMIVISTIIIFLMTILSCSPVAYFWDRDLHGHCLDVNALAYANSGMSIAQDLIIIALPLPVLINLNMSTKKKFGVGFMFGVGSFGCIISMIRLRSLLSFGNSIDPSWDYVDTVTWTSLELAIAIICACLPAIRNLLIRIYPATATFFTTIRPSRGAGGGGRCGNGIESSSGSTKQPSSSSRAWRSGGSTNAAGEEFMELRNSDSEGESGVIENESEEVVMRDSGSEEVIVGTEHDSDHETVDGADYRRASSPLRVKVVHEVWVHSSAASENDDDDERGFNNV